MKVELQGDFLIIDDGNIVISKNPFWDSYALGWGNNMSKSEIQFEDDQIQESDKTVEYDEYPYLYSTSGLTVEESTERALDRVYFEIWSAFNSNEVGDINWLREAIADMIREGKGRQAVYTLAGGIAKGYREGLYKGVPAAYIFKGFVDGYIEKPAEDENNNNYALGPVANPLAGYFG